MTGRRTRQLSNLTAFIEDSNEIKSKEKEKKDERNLPDNLRRDQVRSSPKANLVNSDERYMISFPIRRCNATCVLYCTYVAGNYNTDATLLLVADYF